MKKTLALILIMSGIFLIYMLDRAEVENNREVLQSELSGEADLVMVLLENAVNIRISNTICLKALYELRPDITEEEFAGYAAGIMEDNPAVRALQLTDSNTQVIYVYPPRGNEITITEPMVLLSDPQRAKYTEKAIGQKTMTVQPPFELRQGGLGIVARNPVFADDVFLGMAIAVIDIDEIINDVISRTDTDRFHLHLTDAENNEFYHNCPNERMLVEERKINFADSFWILKLHIADSAANLGWIQRIKIDAMAASVLFLLLFVIYLFRNKSVFLENEVSKRSFELSETENRFELAIENTNAGYFSVDTEGRYNQVNQAWLEMHGYKQKEDILGQSFLKTQTSEEAEEAAGIVEKLLAGEVFKKGEASRLCSDGSVKYHTFTAAPVYRDGKITGFEGFIFDITERKAAEDEKDFLMRELNHRVKNNLLMVNSLVHLKDTALGASADLSDIIHQIDSIRLIHEKLYLSGDFSGIHVNDYFRELLEAIFYSFTAVPVELKYNVEPIVIETKTAVTLGLLINEVATNAVKHAYGNMTDGWFRIEFVKNKTADEYILRLSNNGIAFREDITLAHSGTLGLRLISALTAQMKGNIILKKQPVTLFEIRIPV